MLYVGVDAHKVHSQMTVMDETGTVLERCRAASSREGMLEALDRPPREKTLSGPSGRRRQTHDPGLSSLKTGSVEHKKRGPFGSESDGRGYRG